MDFAQTLDAAVPLAAVLVPSFVLGFGAVWLAMHHGFAQIRAEIAELRNELHKLSERVDRLSERVQGLAERVARIEGWLDPQNASSPATPPVPAGE